MKKLLLALGTLVALAACSSDDNPANDFVPQSCERTVIVYMSGENSLTGYVNTNLKQMKEGSRQLSPSSCLLVFVDKWDTFYGNNFTPTAERQSGVSMYIAQSPFAGNHITYQRDIQKLAWYYAAGYNAVGW